jgi:hypothetical protein
VEAGELAAAAADGGADGFDDDGFGHGGDSFGNTEGTESAEGTELRVGIGRGKRSFVSQKVAERRV